MSTLKLVSRSAVVFILAIFVYKRFNPKQNDHEYLKQLPQHIAELVEKKLAGEIKRFIAKDYTDDKNRTYQDLSGIISLHALQEGQASVYVLSPDVQLDVKQKPFKATLSFKAAMSRGPKEASALNVFPESASVYNFTLQMEKSDEGWLVKSASWDKVTL